VSQRAMVLRVIRYKSDAGKIREFRDALKQSLDLFGVGAIRSRSIRWSDLSLIAESQPKYSGEHLAYCSTTGRFLERIS
jgi:hypothetical protein